MLILAFAAYFPPNSGGGSHGGGGASHADAPLAEGLSDVALGGGGGV